MPTNAQYEAQFAKFKGTYRSLKTAPKLQKFNGDTAAEMFEGLIAEGIPQGDAAQVVIQSWIDMGFENEVAGVVSQTGNFTNDAGNSADNLIPSWAQGPLAFLNDLEQPATWLRIAEGLLGIILIATAVAHMTDAGSIAGKAARAVPFV